MSTFTLLKRNCPICNGDRKDCRQNKPSGIIHCRGDLSIVPPGWKALGQDKWGFEMYIESSNQKSPEAWQERQQEQQAQRQREKEELRRGALSEADRDQAIRRIHRHFGLSSKHRQNLRDRGLCDAHIDRLPYFSFHPGQEVPQFTPANLPGVRRGKLALKESGFACPIPDINGQFTGWQNRFDDTENGKYRWPSGEKSSHLPNGELPIGVYRPDNGVSRRAIGHSEGFIKADVIAQLWGLPTLGAASANFAASPEQWRAYLDKLSGELWTRIIYWFADAGSVSNPHVTGQYLKSWEKLAEWGYEIQVVWWEQLEKAAGDADEISQEVRASARLISTDEYLAIAREHGGIRESSDTTSSQELDRSIDRDQWELRFGVGRWLGQTIKGLLKEAKGFGKKTVTRRKPSVPGLIRYPQDQLPRPEDYEGRELPRIIFKKGKRLEVLAQLKALGWKFVCDKSFTGSGKSHDAGVLSPDPDRAGKIWYFDLNHTNPSTQTIEEMANMPPRHNGMVAIKGKFTPKGNPHLKWAKEDEVAMIPSLCHNADLFVKLKSKGWDVDSEQDYVSTGTGESVTRNPICKQCRFSYKCHQEEGEGYGYLAARREVMEVRRIRASLDSAPNPKGAKKYEYSPDIAFVEEASRYIRGTQSLTAWGSELAQLWQYVERVAPEAFVALQPIRFALQDALNGDFDCIDKGKNRGADHETLLNKLPRPDAIANLPNLIQQVREAMPTIQDVVEEPDSVTGLGGAYRKIGQFARDIMKSQAARQTQQNIEALPPNVLIDALETWAGVKKGSLRVAHKQLQVTVPESRHADILAACGFVVLLDATPNTQYLEEILGDRILQIEQERAPLSNLTVINVNMKGMGSNQISEACKKRQLALLAWITQKHQQVKVLANKSDSHLPLDGWWFNDNRGSNAFKGVEALAAFNMPRPNLGVIQDEYRALFGSLDGFEDYYQGLVEAEIVQVIGRPRVHLYPEEQFTLYLISTNQELSYLNDLGCRVQDKEAFDLTPLAGTPDQITRWKILQAVGQLQDQRQKITQEALATLIGKSQGLISKIAKEFGDWKAFKKLLLALIGLYRGSNNFACLGENEKSLIEEYLSPVVDVSVPAIETAQTPEELEDCVEALNATVVQCIAELGFPKFLEGVRGMSSASQSNLLSVILRGFTELDLAGGSL
jgi:hypothetical protein